MKNTRISKLLFSILLLLFIIFPLSEVSAEGLAVPKATWDKNHPGRISWNLVNEADSYTIQIFGKSKKIFTLRTSNNSLDICKNLYKVYKKYGNVSVRIRSENVLVKNKSKWKFLKGYKNVKFSKQGIYRYAINNFDALKISVNSHSHSVPEFTSGSGDDSEVISSKKMNPIAYAYEVKISDIAPLVDKNVIHAFNDLGFKIYIDPNVKYSGLCETRKRKITLKTESNNDIYHELGHFVAFSAYNKDLTAKFEEIFNAEVKNFPGTYKAYALQNPSEYFAECFREYCLNKNRLRNKCPRTFKYIEACLTIISNQKNLDKLKIFHSRVWNTN